MVMALFPQGLTAFARLIGIIDAPNAVFMVVIFLLIVVVFYLNIRISRLSMQLRDLVQKLGLQSKTPKTENPPTKPFK